MLDSLSKDSNQLYAPPSRSLRQALLAKIPQNKQSYSTTNPGTFVEASESMEQNLKELQLLESIKKYQEKDKPGYISYMPWKQIHESLWGSRVAGIAEKTWKILRLINGGEVHLPTGLVFEILKAVTIDSSASNAKQVLQKFLLRNKIQGGLHGFRDLKNYPTFQQIIAQYHNKDKQSSAVRNKRKKNDQQIFTRLNQQNKERQHKLLQLRYSSIAQEMRQCTFVPSISPYTSQPSRINSHHKTCLPKQESIKQEPNCNFKATAIDFKIYDKSIKDIPGAKTHIKKYLLCQHERQRLQRFISKPFGSFK